MASPNQPNIADEFDELNDPAFREKLKHIDERLAMLKDLDKSFTQKPEYSFLKLH